MNGLIAAATHLGSGIAWTWLRLFWPPIRWVGGKWFRLVYSQYAPVGWLLRWRYGHDYL